MCLGSAGAACYLVSFGSRAVVCASKGIATGLPPIASDLLHCPSQQYRRIPEVSAPLPRAGNSGWCKTSVSIRDDSGTTDGTENHEIEIKLPSRDGRPARSRSSSLHKLRGVR